MADLVNTRVIAYTGDITDITRKLREIEIANRSAFKVISGDLANNINKISTNYEKLGTTNLTKLDKTMGKLKTNTSTTSNIVKLANGNLLKLTETTKIFSKAIKGAGKDEPKFQTFKEVTTSVNNANKSISGFSKSMSVLSGKSSQLGTNFQSVTDINNKFSTQLKGVGHAVKLISSDLKTTSGGVTKLGSVVKTADGKFLKLQDTITRTPQGLQKVSRSVQNVTKDYVKSAKGATKLDKANITLSENMKRLAKRALITIPIWMALRGAMMAVSVSIKDGFRNIAIMDKALQKAKRNMTGSTQEINANFTKLKKEATDMSLQTGVAVEDIITAFQRFATTGQDFETSMAGARASTSLAVVQFGDTKGVADALARSYKLLKHTIKGASTEDEKMYKISALIDELWKTNAFDINDMGKALDRFSGTANSMNIGMEDSIKLLATLHNSSMQQSKAGRSLSTTMLKMLSNMTEVSKELNIRFNPATDNAVSSLLKVVDALVKVKNEGKLGGIIESSKIMKDLFRIRGTELVSSLVAMHKVLKQNMALTGDVDKFKKSVKETTETTGVLVDRFHKVNIEIGKAFVRGLTGEEEYKKGLLEIVQTLEQLIKVSETTGTALNKMFDVTLAGKYVQILQTIMDEEDKRFKKTLAFRDLVDKGISGDLGLKDTLDVLDRLKKGTKKGLSLGINTDITTKILEDNIDKLSEKLKYKISKAMKVGFSGDELKKLQSELNGIDFKVLDMQEKDFDDFKTGLSNAIIKANEDANKKIETKKIETKKLKTVIPTNVSILPDELEKVNQAIIDANINQLKEEGALTSEIIDRKSKLEELFKIKQDGITLIERELDKEKALTEEKRLQGRLGNDSLKLFRIAQKEGTNVAKKLGDVLAGKTDLSLFLKKGGKEVDIFKKNFGDILEQQKALAFFKGDIVPGDKTLRGGRQISIKESGVRRLSPIAQTEIERNKLLRQQFPKEIIKQAPKTEVSVANQIIVNASSVKEVSDAVTKKWLKEADKIGSDIRNKLEQVMYGNQQSNR